MIRCLRRSGDLPGAQHRARQMLGTAQQPLHVERRELFSTLSIGVALPEYGAACNRVRRAGGNDFAIYDEAMVQAAAKSLRMIGDLQHAVENRELRLHYQPTVDAANGRLPGMEALVRWRTLSMA